MENWSMEIIFSKNIIIMVKVIVMVAQKLAVMMVNYSKIVFPSICKEVKI